MRDIDRLFRTTQQLRRFEYGPRPATLQQVSNAGYLTANQTITLSGDLSGSGTTSINAQIAANAVGTVELANGSVTYAKVQNVVAARLLGNPTGSAAAPSEISLGTGLSFSGTVLNATAGGVGTVTSIAAGTGITVSPSPITGSGTVSLTVPVSVANGGTGATSAGATPWVQKAGDTVTGNLQVNGLLQMAGATAGFPALKRNGGTLEVRTADDSAYAPIYTQGLTATGGATIGPANFSLHITASSSQGAAIDYNNGVRFWYAGVQPSGYFAIGDITSSRDVLVIDSPNSRAVFQAFDVTVGGNYLRLAGDLTGSLNNPGGGSVIYGDASYIAFKCGSGNGGYFWQDGTGANFLLLNPTSGGSLTLNFGQAYKPAGGPWQATSDIRVKRNVAAYDTGLAAVLRLNPVSYEYNGKGGTVADGKTYVGLVAQDVQPVMPEMVGLQPPPGGIDVQPDPEGLTDILTLDANALTFALVNAVKELAARVAVLEGRAA